DDAVEGGCNGNVTALVHTRGTAAHSARPWMGHNAIHEVGDVLQRIERGQLPDVDVDGLTFRQSLNAVGLRGGIADNVIPDHAVVTVNLRFAPQWDPDRAVSYLVDEVFAGLEVEISDRSAGSRPGLDRPAAAAFVEELGLPVRAKQGWTDVARFTALGVPAVNFGPGEAQYAHADEERCHTDQIIAAEAALRRWLT